jgi:hypothetical protein
MTRAVITFFRCWWLSPHTMMVITPHPYFPQANTIVTFVSTSGRTIKHRGSFSGVLCTVRLALQVKPQIPEPNLILLSVARNLLPSLDDNGGSTFVIPYLVQEAMFAMIPALCLSSILEPLVISYNPRGPGCLRVIPKKPPYYYCWWIALVHIICTRAAACRIDGGFCLPSVRCLRYTTG